MSEESKKKRTAKTKKQTAENRFEFQDKVDSRTFGMGMKRKLITFVMIIFVVFILLAAYMAKINSTKGEKYSQRVYDNLKYKNNTIVAKRGEITDRSGSTLAYSEKVYNLILDPKIYWAENTDREANLNAVCECFGLDRSEIAGIFNQYKNTGKAYVKVLSKLTEEEVLSYKELAASDSKIVASWLEEEYKRVYPFGSLAAAVIGYASESQGVIGIENYYNSYLTGTNGREYGYVGEDANLETTVKPAINGNRVVLTIDQNVQRIVEKKLKEFNEEYGSRTTAAIIMNPNNGEILSMAQYPDFDLNDPKNLSGYYTDEEIAAMTDEDMVEAYYGIWSNYCVSNIYEPGSVFKTFTIAGGIEEGILDGTEVYFCDGSEEVSGVTISCAHTEGHGELTLSQALEESCNDALMQIAATIGIDYFSDFIRRLGFGSKTGIDLPSEEYGLLYAKDAMTAIDLATNSFGQNLNVTMVQQLAAFSSIINGGSYYQPHLVKRIESQSGETVFTNDSLLVRQTVSAETSETMREYLKNVVDYGTGGYLKIAGYSVGGKTGAAEKQPRDKTHYIISFIGFMPVENPQVVFYVIIDEAEVEDFASSRAAQELARDIMYELIPYLEIYPEDEEFEINIPNFSEEETTPDSGENGDEGAGENDDENIAETSGENENENTTETSGENSDNVEETGGEIETPQSG